MKRWLALIAATGVIAIGLVITVHNVPQAATSQDTAVAAALMGLPTDDPDAFTTPRTLDGQIELVIAVQAAVLAAAPLDEGLPLGQPRELAQLVEAGKGLCYDRSRAIETILRLYGLEMRHVAIYSTAETGSAIRSLLTPGIASHAVSEVKTAAGWLAIDSNAPWIGLTADGQVIDTRALHDRPDLAWDPRVAAPPNGIFSEGFTLVYGLYSRHGRFYAPFNAIPDYNIAELTHNLTALVN